MKKLTIALLLLILINNLYASDLEKLENQYFNKIDQAEKEYQTKTLSLTKSYLESLHKLLERETKKGDFDSAVKIKKKIVEIDNALLGQSAMNKSNKDIKLIGTWQHMHNKNKTTYIIHRTGIITNSQKQKGRWLMINDFDFIVVWDHEKKLQQHSISSDGKYLMVKDEKWAICVE